MRFFQYAIHTTANLKEKKHAICSLNFSFFGVKVIMLQGTLLSQRIGVELIGEHFTLLVASYVGKRLAWLENDTSPPRLFCLRVAGSLGVEFTLTPAVPLRIICRCYSHSIVFPLRWRLSLFPSLTSNVYGAIFCILYVNN